ncbi:uncharacterized protein K02A2.6-like [Uranotaenia lowii]|uniref:uncharacterized protein K02A2.6-like n=1 Tax=Uranotaenia lowii TaxID=190385 RepID=UPI00247A282B|nr:uncharacterized protein K02A2.6-like [Uranotaenia lowii]
MLNRDLASSARNHGYATTQIVQIATRAEASNVEASTSTGIFRVERRNFEHTRRDDLKRRSRIPFRGPQSKQFRNNNNQQLRRSNQRCPNCNYEKLPNHRCPALTRKCRKCKQFGHYAEVCLSKPVYAVEDNAAALTKQENDQEVNALSIEDVLIKCHVGGSAPIEFLIDSGADVNVIAGHDWSQLKKIYEQGKLNISFLNHTGYNQLRAYGTIQPLVVECAFRAKVDVVELSKPSVEAEFLVVQTGRRSLLGWSTANDLRLLEVGASVNACLEQSQIEVFPKMPGVKIKFSVDPKIPPVRNAYFNVPASLREAARKRLECMEAQGIIEKVTTAPDWISGMSAVPKGKNDFRLVVNMRAPNRAIKREYFRLPTIDEIKTKLHGSKYFSKLDLSNAFYHLELSKESRELTTFLSEAGMYRFTRLMFGVNCAPEVFQREMTRILEEVPNVIVYIDDILVFAKSLQELHASIALVLQILRRNNLTLNSEKCEFDKQRIKFLGHLLDEKGFHIDEEKVRAVNKFREPKTASELRSFLGLASFLGPHIQNFSDLTNPLWSVATTKSWSWGPLQKKSFEETKKRIVECTTTLGYFSNEHRTILYTDASPNALGAVLVQENERSVARVISFASKALTETEKRYAQNQREALGAVWAVEHFSYFLFGRHFTLRTDAQGVAFILNRSRENTKRALTRADGWALRLSPYSYTVEYVRGSENIADPSSRLYCGSDGPFQDEESPWEIASLQTSSFEFLTEENIKDATLDDNLLQKVMACLDLNEWDKDTQNFKAFAEDLSVKDGILIKRGCAVIPHSLRETALNVAHSGHPRAAKMKSIMRERVWWPGMATDVEKWVHACQTCATNGRPEKPAPMQRSFAPKAVWHTIAIDFNGPYAKFNGISIFVVVDCRSRYLIAKPVQSTSFENVKKVLDEIFDKEGFPHNIKSDNGPPFNGSEYKNYCSERGINLIYSMPYHPQQNGLVEGYMKLINRAMAAAVSRGTSYVEEIRNAVQSHNAAEHSVTKIPPEEVLSGRKIRRRLPLLCPGRSEFDDNELNERDRKSKLQGKRTEDSRRGAKACSVKPGDIVIVERVMRSKGESRFDPKRYTVIKERNGDLLLSDEMGQTLKRNVVHTRRVHEWKVFNQPPLNDLVGQGRPSRERKVPVHLQDYVRVCEQEVNERSEITQQLK